MVVSISGNIDLHGGLITSKTLLLKISLIQVSCTTWIAWGFALLRYFKMILMRWKLCGTITVSDVKRTRNVLMEGQMSFTTLLASLGYLMVLKSLNVNDIVIAESFWKENPLFGCSLVFTSFAINIINENNLETPRNIIEATHLHELMLCKIIDF